MGILINIESRLPHCSGNAICFDCNHEWIAVAPTVTTWLQCPSCKLTRGRFKYPHQREGLEWKCNCGNDLFHLKPEGMYCPNCGNWVTGY